MNDYELSQLNYDKVIELHGQPNPNPHLKDIVLRSEFSGSRVIANPSRYAVYIIASRVVEISGDSKRLRIRDVYQYFSDGASCPRTEEKWVDASDFSQAITEHIADDERLRSLL